MMQVFQAKPTSNGYTLIEVMIAMLLGIFLVTGLIQIFIASKQSYRMQETLSRLQESGRFALEFIERDIRMTGYRGCASKSKAKPINLLVNKTNYLYNFDLPIQGFNNVAANGVNVVAAGITTPVVGGTDIITIRRADSDGVQITNQASVSTALTLSRNTVPGLKSCDVVIAADCQAATVFQLTNADPVAINSVAHAAGGCTSTGTGGNSSAALDKKYVGGNLYRFLTTSYFIKNNANGQPSLYRKVNANAEEELVEGVEQMQVKYGYDTDGAADRNANTYLDANAVPDWANVVSVRVSLLVRTVDDNIAAEPLVYTYNEKTYDGTGGNAKPTDRRIRRVFTATVAIRNKLL